MSMEQGRDFTEVSLGEALKSVAEYGVSTFTQLREEANKNGVSVVKAALERQNKRLDSKTDVVSFRLIGGNGMGKTERSISSIAAELKAQGFNPVVYREGVYPKNIEKDVLILHMNCVGASDIDFKGVPHAKDVMVPLCDEDGIPQYGEDGNILMTPEKQLVYAGSGPFRAANMFAYVVAIMDEPNRATRAGMEILTALYGGEAKDGVRLGRGASIIVSTQNAEDGMNFVGKADAAQRSKISTFKVKFLTDEFLEWAVGANVHPAIRIFAKMKKDLLENFKDAQVNEAAPLTARGLVRMSDVLYSMEESNQKDKMSKDELLQRVEVWGMATMGDHPDSEEKISEQFANLYVNEIIDVLPAAQSVFKNAEMQIGISEKFDLRYDLLNRTERMRSHIPEEKLRQIKMYSATESAAANNKIDAFCMYVAKEANDIMNDRDRFWLKVAAYYHNREHLYDAALDKLKGMGESELSEWLAHAAREFGYQSTDKGEDRLEKAAMFVARSKEGVYEELFKEPAPQRSTPEVNESDLKNLDLNVRKELVEKLRVKIVKEGNRLAEGAFWGYASGLWGRCASALCVLDASSHEIFKETLKNMGRQWLQGNQWFDIMNKLNLCKTDDYENKYAQGCLLQMYLTAISRLKYSLTVDQNRQTPEMKKYYEDIVHGLEQQQHDLREDARLDNFETLYTPAG